MFEVKIEKATQEKVEQMQILSWGVWEKEVCSFNWHYDETEVCYFLKGRVIVKLEDGREMECGTGDLVIFPKGLSCVWDIKEPVKKHYNFL